MSQGSAPSRDEPRLPAGRVGRPHGLDGSFYVTEARPALLAVGATVMVEGRELRITRRAGADARPIVALESCCDREAAQALGGRELLVRRSEAPELEPDEWWAEDLEGCAVRDGEQAVGMVRRLIALPSCEVLEVERAGAKDPLLVPLVGDAVREVDVDRRLIDVDLAFLGEA